MQLISGQEALSKLDLIKSMSGLNFSSSHKYCYIAGPQLKVVGILSGGRGGVGDLQAKLRAIIMH